MPLSPAETMTVTPALELESGVMTEVALPSLVSVLIGLAVPSATTLKFTGTPSATSSPLESVTFAVTVDFSVPSHLMVEASAVRTFELGGPPTVRSSVALVRRAEDRAARQRAANQVDLGVYRDLARLLAAADDGVGCRRQSLVRRL